MPSILDLNLEKVADLHILPEGKAELQVQSLKYGLSKKGNPMITSWFIDPNDTSTKSIGHWMLLPSEGDDARIADGRRRDIKNFCVSFKYPFSEFQKALAAAASNFTGPDAVKIDLPANNGTVLVSATFSDSGEEVNVIRKFL